MLTSRSSSTSIRNFRPRFLSNIRRILCDFGSLSGPYLNPLPPPYFLHTNPSYSAARPPYELAGVRLLRRHVSHDSVTVRPSPSPWSSPLSSSSPCASPWTIFPIFPAPDRAPRPRPKPSPSASNSGEALPAQESACVTAEHASVTASPFYIGR